MKILSINSSGFEEGGVENGLALLKPIFLKRGHDFRILTSNLRPDLPHFTNYEFKAIDSSSLTKYIYVSFNPYSYKVLKKILKEFQPDIVDLHTMTQPSPSILFLLRNYPTVLTIHGPEVFTKSLLLWYMPAKTFKKGKEYSFSGLTFVGYAHYLYNRFITGTVYAFGLHNVDKIIAVSGYIQRLMAKDGLTTDLIPNATKLLQYNPLDSAHIKHKLLYAGRLEKFKGVDYFIKGLPLIISKFPDTQLYIAGDGSYRQNLEELTKKLKLNNAVTFLGHLSRKELEALYRDSTVVVVPSIWPEAFGKIGIEAMSVGRPVVASDVGGISDWLVDGETGYLVPPKDPAAIADSVIKLFSDEQLLVKMSVAARKRAEEFDIEKYVDRLEAVYAELINKYKK